MDRSEFGYHSDAEITGAVRGEDTAHMRHALSLALRGWGQTAPNPMVGAVVVQGGLAVGEGFHAQYGEDHAEVVALQEAGDKASGATLYVTLEPCAHHGKTPPCTDAIVKSGVARVVVAVGDPNPLAGGGLQKLRAAGIETVAGVEREAATELNAAFINRFRSRRPWVTLKLAMTIDGAIADSSGDSGWITGEDARAEVHRMRAGSDAIAVGMKTVIADDPRLSARSSPAPRRQPARVVFGRGDAFPMTSNLAQTANEVPTYLISYHANDSSLPQLRRAGVEVLEARDLRDSLNQLRERGIDSLLLEGGAGLAGEFIRQACVDRLVIFQAPIVLGRGSLNAFSGLEARSLTDALRLQVLRRETFGDDLMTVYAFPEA